MLTRLFLLCSFFALAFNAFGQADADAVKLADEMYGFGDKRDALDVYLQAATLNPKNVRANYMAGKCYQETIEKEKSVKYLIKAYELDKDVSQDISYLIGKGYQFGANFDKAIEYFEEYKKDLDRTNPKNKEDLVKRADKHIEECNNAKIAYSQGSSKELVNLGPVINTEYAEYCPVISADESLLIFTSRRQGTTGNKKDVDNEFFEDIYVSKKGANGEWGTPENIGPTINTEFHEASNGLSHDGTELYIFKEDNGGDIYKCVQTVDGNWSKPMRLDHVNTKYDETSITFSEDGKTMIFASDRPGGLGRLDLYISKQDKKGRWGKPENIGSILNTQYDEDSPFLTPDGKTLFFSSDGHNSMGGYDIYKTTLDNGKWSKPENLGYPVNTTDDDIYYVESGDGLHGYYSSVRSNGSGEKDLYMITNKKPAEEPKPVEVAKVEEKKDTAVAQVAEKVEEVKEEVKKEELKAEEPVKVEAPVKEEPVAVAKPTFKSVTVKGRVFDVESGAPIPATVDVIDEKGKILQQITTTEDGYYTLVLNEKKNRNFTFLVKPAGYLKKSLKVAIKPAFEETETVQDLALSKYVAGQKYILRNIYFDFNRASLKPESAEELQKLVDMLKNNPEAKIEIGGHTDYVGSMEYNKALSQKRAQEVVNYLISKGISPNRLTAIGYGKEHPLASNDDEEEGRELNRRTEFKIL